MAKEHPADIFSRQQIAAAASFVIYFLKGPTDRYREEAATQADARIIADRMNAEHGGNGRRAMIYAILPNGSALPIGEPYRIKPVAR